MIGRLQGIILLKQPPELLLDINGIAYELFASMNTFYALPEINHEVTLHTHLIVREDAQTLYGFHSLHERTLFRSLIKVNGVGPKLALTILSSINPNDFAACVANNDAASLVRIPGVGKKTAERLIIEMRDRLTDWHTEEIKSTSAASSTSATSHNAAQEAISALISLGYKPQEASRAVSKIEDNTLTSEKIIRRALKGMIKQS
jgi:holliday junction DNA helicase RuvA